MGLETGYLYDNANVVWYGTETYNQALNALKTVTGKSDYAVEVMLNGQYGAADYWSAVQALEDNGVIIAKNSNGYNCFAYASDVTMTAPSGPMYQVDSGATSTTLVKGAPVYDVTVDDVAASPTYGKVVTNPVGSLLTPEHGFYGWQFFAGECLQGIGAASWGISLGKTIDSALYNLNPDFWNAAGMSGLNPETWSSITNGDDSFAAGLFNTIFGINPNSGKAQMFVDQNALAYIAQWMASEGLFAPSTSQVISTNVDGITLVPPIPIASFSFATTTITTDSGSTFSAALSTIPVGVFSSQEYGNVPIYLRYDNYSLVSKIVACTFYNSTSSYPGYALEFNSSPRPNQRYGGMYALLPNGRYQSLGSITFNAPSTVNGKYISVGNIVTATGYAPVLPMMPDQGSINSTSNLGYGILYGQVQDAETIEGIGNQPNAQLPDVSSWTTPESTLQSLQQQYPDLWNNAVPNTIVQPDGSTKTITYVPVALANADGQWDTQPTSDINNSSQTHPEVEPLTSPTPENNDLLKLILQLITMPEPQPDTQTQTQTQPNTDIPNMPTTGDGSSPTPSPASGSASSLWAVYHPTQGEINSFGAWLWSSNFVDQLLKVFQNPMDAIITLHKVFVTPTDAGTTTIHAGYLDSNVSSAYVTQQYEYVNCGSVDCKEYFGTVFDYLGTSVSLYLPFIGIVPLNVDEVMRSTINVQYGCDLFTGAILAEVTVTRDGNDIIMYQYGGDGSVQYPVSGSRSGGFLTGLAATIGAAASVATGGALLPAAATALGGSVMSAQKQVQHSGGFSGNSGAMGCKTPYLIIERPQIKTAVTFPRIEGYPTNYSSRLRDLNGQVNVKSVHVEGINATDVELKEIESLLKSGVLV